MRKSELQRGRAASQGVARSRNKQPGKKCKGLLESLGQGMPVVVVATFLLSEGWASTG